LISFPPFGRLVGGALRPQRTCGRGSIIFLILFFPLSPAKGRSVLDRASLLPFRGKAQRKERTRTESKPRKMSPFPSRAHGLPPGEARQRHDQRTLRDMLGLKVLSLVSLSLVGGRLREPLLICLFILGLKGPSPSSTNRCRPKAGNNFTAIARLRLGAWGET